VTEPRPEPRVDQELVDYYRRRASEYEAIYALPERQADLATLRGTVAARLAGARVLEIACGTGYWTALIAATAQAVLATDYAEEPMRIARAKSYPEGKVRFELADAYALEAALGRCDAAFAGFWWSHVPRERLEEFLASLHARLEPGARVLLLDNLYVEGNSTPIAGIDKTGNTYQMRTLGDGSRVRVLKNFVSQAELRERLAPCAAAFSFEALQYYWLAEYRLK
jgi:demethylmenaquinone methyltransferase/2-methoxy-6-polyprenyl-1,4-benzoquinol methylase